MSLLQAPSALSRPRHPWHSANSRALCLFSPWPGCPGGWPRQILELVLVIQQDGAFCLSPSILTLGPNEWPKGWNCPLDISAGREDLGSNYPDAFWVSRPLKFQLKMLLVLVFGFFHPHLAPSPPLPDRGHCLPWCRSSLQTPDTPGVLQSKRMASCVVEQNTTCAIISEALPRPPFSLNPHDDNDVTLLVMQHSCESVDSRCKERPNRQWAIDVSSSDHVGHLWVPSTHLRVESPELAWQA